MRENLLLQACCAPCAVYPIKILRDRFIVTILFYGPNIYPPEEYKRRLESARSFSDNLKIRFIELLYNPVEWQEKVRGFENEPEGGRRCILCCRIRLERTAQYAAENGYKYFGTTLTQSPHKPADIINSIGKEIGEKYKAVFLAEDFKKMNGFKKGCALSRELGLYRQNYCGCEYSLKQLGKR